MTERKITLVEGRRTAPAGHVLAAGLLAAQARRELAPHLPHELGHAPLVGPLDREDHLLGLGSLDFFSILHFLSPGEIPPKRPV